MFYVYAFVVFLLFMLLTSPIKQDLSFHNFAGDGGHTCCKIPNYGMVHMNSIAWTGFNIGSILVFLGSSYYHWNPNNNTLVWDRMPMTLCTMSMTYIVYNDYLDYFTIGDLMFWWYIGVSSVIYWHFTDDLRLYAYVQYLPVLIILYFIYSPNYQSKNINENTLLFALVIYVMARVVEYFDWFFYRNMFFSGHVWKHLMCGGAMYLFIQSVEE